MERTAPDDALASPRPLATGPMPLLALPRDTIKIVLDYAGGGSPVWMLMLSHICKAFRSMVLELAAEEAVRAKAGAVAVQFSSGYPRNLLDVAASEAIRFRRIEGLRAHKLEFLLSAIAYKNFRLVKWFMQESGLKVPLGFTCKQAVEYGSASIVELLWSSRVPMGCDVLVCAAERGNAEVVAWAANMIDFTYQDKIRALVSGRRFIGEREMAELCDKHDKAEALLDELRPARPTKKQRARDTSLPATVAAHYSALLESIAEFDPATAKAERDEAEEECVGFWSQRKSEQSRLAPHVAALYERAV